MNLFTTLAGILKENTDITIVVRKNSDGRIVVSTALKNNNVNDVAKNVIAPFVVSGTPEEMDAEFVNLITKPMEESTGIQTSMENFEASKKAAQAKSQAAAEKKKQEDEEKKKAKAETDKAVKEADKLFADKKYDAAKTLYQKAAATAEGADKSRIQKQIDLCEKNAQPDIFESFDQEEETAASENETTEEPEPETDSEEEPEEQLTAQDTDSDKEEETAGEPADKVNPLNF